MKQHSRRRPAESLKETPKRSLAGGEILSFVKSAHSLKEKSTGLNIPANLPAFTILVRLIANPSATMKWIKAWWKWRWLDWRVNKEYSIQSPASHALGIRGQLVNWSGEGREALNILKQILVRKKREQQNIAVYSSYYAIFLPEPIKVSAELEWPKKRAHTRKTSYGLPLRKTMHPW